MNRFQKLDLSGAVSNKLFCISEGSSATILGLSFILCYGFRYEWIYHAIIIHRLKRNYLSAGKELEKLADEIGFSKARHYEIGGGSMGNLVATK